MKHIDKLGKPGLLKRFHEVLDYNPETGKLIWTTSRDFGREAGGYNNNSYLTIGIDQVRYLVHRVVWLMHYGTVPAPELDHINRVRDDNRIANLREVTDSENALNKSVGKRNISGAVGVSWSAADNGWFSRIKVNGRLHHLGCFKDKEAAIAIRKLAEQRYSNGIL